MEQLVSAARVLDMPLNDHAVVGRGRFEAFTERGWL